jgi:hypothetical protein
MLIIPRVMLRSPLMARGGFAVFRGLFAPALMTGLRREAQRQIQHAQDVRVERSDAESVRGGDPARKYLNAPGGEIQQSIYLDPVLRRTVSSTVGLATVPTGAGGTFTYYCRPGDFLTIHRDIVTCDVAVITCVEDSGVQGSGGKLCVYPERIREGLPSLRRDPVTGAVPVRLEPGDTIVLLGGIVPHCALPVSEGQRRVVSLLCYRALVD